MIRNGLRPSENHKKWFNEKENYGKVLLYKKSNCTENNDKEGRNP